jgi:hypothetical protein
VFCGVVLIGIETQRRATIARDDEQRRWRIGAPHRDGQHRS